jgi:hypothetical protein
MSSEWFDPLQPVHYAHRGMKRDVTRVVWMCLVLLAACASDPPPAPVSLQVPPPPEVRPGAIEVYGDRLPLERAAHIREKLRAAEPALFMAYKSYFEESNGTAGEGRVQLRLGINGQGEVAEIDRVYSETSNRLGPELRPVLEQIRFDAGPEAWVYYSLDFRPDPLEVLQVGTDFAHDVPVIVAIVENRSAFHFSVVSATVTVLGPEKSKPLRVYRRRISAAFSPGERRELRVPVGGEWATERNSFLVTVRPSRAGTAGSDEKGEESGAPGAGGAS